MYHTSRGWRFYLRYVSYGHTLCEGEGEGGDCGAACLVEMLKLLGLKA